MTVIGKYTSVFTTKHDAQPHFSGIYANARNENWPQYSQAFTLRPQDHQLKFFATRIFRELPTITAMTRLIGDTPTDIHIVGCSDGSEAFAYAIAMHKQYGDAVAKRVKIIGIDREPSMVGIAKTGHLVCTDLEREWSNNQERQPDHPLKGDGWEKYLVKKDNAPTGFNALTAQFPPLAQITRDPVANISIGKGMHWYEVRKNGLPPMTFHVNDMEQYVKHKPSNQAQQQVYVLANALAYLVKDMNDGQQIIGKILGTIQDIKEQNQGKPVYIVLGDLEDQMFRQIPQLIPYLKMIGMEPVSKEEIARTGVKKADQAFGNIWRLMPGPRVQFVMAGK